MTDLLGFSNLRSFEVHFSI